MRSLLRWTGVICPKQDRIGAYQNGVTICKYGSCVRICRYLSLRVLTCRMRSGQVGMFFVATARGALLRLGELVIGAVRVGRAAWRRRGGPASLVERWGEAGAGAFG